jgi:flagellar biosynthesis protein FlhF
MIIKKYVANTVKDAENLMRQELGPKAVILATRYQKQKGLKAFFLPDRVEVTAAVEEDELKGFTDEKLGTKPTALNGNLSDLKKSFSPNKIASSSTVYGDPRLKMNQQQKNESVGTNTTDSVRLSLAAQTVQTKNVRVPDTSASQEVDMDLARRKLGALRSSSHSAVKASQDMERLTGGLVSHFKEEEIEAKETQKVPTNTPGVETLDMMRKVIREELSSSEPTHARTPLINDTVGSIRFLVAKGLDYFIAQEIEDDLNKQFGKVDMTVPSKQRTVRLNALKKALAGKIETAGPILLKEKKTTTVAIVGPTGVGKTTTLIKIASRYTEQLKKKVGIISLDTTKTGAQEQIRTLAYRIGCPILTASSTFELEQAVETFQDRDLVLIDSAGRSQYHWQEVDDLADMLSVVNDLNTILVISATTKDLDAFGTIHEFSRLSIDSVAFTKLDESIAHGVLVNVCEKMKVPLSYLAMGQDVKSDLKIADRDAIARSILTQHNTQEFNTIRQLLHAPTHRELLKLS